VYYSSILFLTCPTLFSTQINHWNKMNSPSAINRNNYAAPNTPIASSKQPKKKTTPTLASPVAKSRPEAGLAAAGR
jgi:hypothetical protein